MCPIHLDALGVACHTSYSVCVPIHLDALGVTCHTCVGCDQGMAVVGDCDCVGSIEYRGGGC